MTIDTTLWILVRASQIDGLMLAVGALLFGFCIGKLLRFYKDKQGRKNKW